MNIYIYTESSVAELGRESRGTSKAPLAAARYSGVRNWTSYGCIKLAMAILSLSLSRSLALPLCLSLSLFLSRYIYIYTYIYIYI